jgi:hypothetical protein
MAPGEGSPAVWIGIPSVPARRIGQAFLSFYLALTIAFVVDSLLVYNNHGPLVWTLVAEEVLDDGGSLVGWALAMTWPIMEVFRMVLASIFEKRAVNRGREEMNRLWADWNRRRVQAEERGEPFDEPPPDINATTRKNRGNILT